MTLVFVVGWVAAFVGTVSGIPQLIRLIRTRDVNGLSVIGWQVILGLNLGWLAHGVLVGQVNLMVPNVLGMATSLSVLYLMSRVLRRSFPLILVSGVLTGAAMFACDLIFGSSMFGLIAIIPAIVANAGQSIELVRAPVVRGVSAPTLVAAFLNQVMWTWWGILVPEPGTVIAASATGLICGFSLLWWILRKVGVPALWPHAVVVVPGPDELVEDLSLPA